MELTRVRERSGTDTLENQLANLHALKERNWVLREIDHFERDRSFETSMNGRCGEMNEKPHSRERASSFDSRGVTRPAFPNREVNSLESVAQNELVRREREAAVRINVTRFIELREKGSD